MRLQILMSVMNQTHDIVKQANIQSDAIIVNQCDEFKKEVFDHNGHTIQFLSFDERGVGRSRNAALMRADADIVLLSDQNVVYDDNYEQIILDAFEANPQADMLVFNVPTEDPERKTYTINQQHRVRRRNCLRYGAVRMAIRIESAKRSNISFSLLFGGGAKYSSGEDSLFIYEAIRKGLRVEAIPQTIGNVKAHESSWFSGYTDKFFKDKGALFKVLAPKLHQLYILQFAVRKQKTMGDGRSVMELIRLMREGAREI